MAERGLARADWRAGGIAFHTESAAIPLWYRLAQLAENTRLEPVSQVDRDKLLDRDEGRLGLSNQKPRKDAPCGLAAFVPRHPALALV